MSGLFSIVAMLVLLLFGGVAIWATYTASNYYDEYKKTGDVVKFHGAIFLLLEAIFLMMVIK